MLSNCLSERKHAMHRIKWRNNDVKWGTKSMLWYYCIDQIIFNFTATDMSWLWGEEMGILLSDNKTGACSSRDLDESFQQLLRRLVAVFPCHSQNKSCCKQWEWLRGGRWQLDIASIRKHGANGVFQAEEQIPFHRRSIIKKSSHNSACYNLMES